jgi:hypothetical protein
MGKRIGFPRYPKLSVVGDLRTLVSVAAGYSQSLPWHVREPQHAQPRPPKPCASEDRNQL